MSISMSSYLTVTELLPKKFMESTQDLKHVTYLETTDVPRIGEIITIDGKHWDVAGIERNYDTGDIFVLVKSRHRDIMDELNLSDFG